MKSELNLYQKLAKIRKPVQVLKKNKSGYGYRYVDEEAILSKISVLMDKYEVSLIPSISPTTIVVAPHTYSKTKTTKTGNIFEEKVNEVVVQAEMVYMWVNDANPEERISVPWMMVGSQSDASQAFGSALTYSNRYFLLKYFGIATSDSDPDEFRRRQKEAEDEENRLIVKAVVDQIHSFVTKHLADHPEDRELVLEITKKYVKEKGKPSANYYAIKDVETATALNTALREEFKTGEETDV